MCRPVTLNSHDLTIAYLHLMHSYYHRFRHLFACGQYAALWPGPLDHLERHMCVKSVFGNQLQEN